MWRAKDGERIGSYHGHNGAVYAVDVNRKSTRMITAGADNKAKVWDVELGTQLFSLDLRTPGRAIEFAQGDKKFMIATDAVMGYASTILIFSFFEDSNRLSTTPIQTITVDSGMKVLDLAWGPLNKHIFATTDNGKVLIYDSETLEKVKEITDNHDNNPDGECEVKRIAISKDRMCFLTACTDKTVRLYDSTTFRPIKVYETGRPCNSADIYPENDLGLDHILLAGGQSADQVTTTRVDPTQFATRVYHKIFQEELAMITGHFGPVNDVRYNPNGTRFVFLIYDYDYDYCFIFVLVDFFFLLLCFSFFSFLFFSFLFFSFLFFCFAMLHYFLGFIFIWCFILFLSSFPFPFPSFPSLVQPLFSFSLPHHSFATGGEDGYVRLNILDDTYFEGLSNEAYFAKLNNRVALR